MRKNIDTTEDQGPHMTEKETKLYKRVMNFLHWLKPYAGLYLIVVLGCATTLAVLWFIPEGESSDSLSDSGSSYTSSSECNVLGLNLHGMLLTYVPPGNDDDMLSDKDVTGSEDLVSGILTAQDDDSIKAVILEIDSGGGYPVAGEEIAEALKELGKPSVAVIRQTGASAAYWAATGADKIFASKNSDVGSIGVTMSYLQDINKDKKWVELSTGKYKDTGDRDKPLTEDERQLILRDLNIVYQNFMQAVAENRKIPIDQVKAISDGSTVLGEKAKALGLVDELGSWMQAKKYLEQRIGAKAEICWY